MSGNPEGDFGLDDVAGTGAPLTTPGGDTVNQGNPVSLTVPDAPVFEAMGVTATGESGKTIILTLKGPDGTILSEVPVCNDRFLYFFK